MDKQLILRELEALHELLATHEHKPHEANGVWLALEVVERLPDDSQWAPVKERLPEDGDTVWVTANYMGSLRVTESLYTGKCFIDQRGVSLNHVVTAWKPREVMLPYKEE